ncbi:MULTISPECIES: M15 family metallopeptidase [unclassified Shewanella]|uniref:M15 family metallopeptidase n=1 Tax=unclassified Shewanella TaxID=196818 RepID=UPI000CBFDD49|nr:MULTISPECIES: M15 family metallopeptidase [unclassified Shewanella]MDO6619273.1 M15 family metallopeptidase [Shewanella sp. 6_MG-2023]PMH99532.1 peptidase M15 [Shewanella sp. 10N.286.48.A6]
MLNVDISNPALYGLDESQLVTVQGHLLTQKTADAFGQMQQHAVLDGIAIELCSAHRNFAKQAAIWNAKAQGKRILLDLNNQVLDCQNLTDDQLVDAILNWSALPGASRHHWGTDIDVYDGNNINRQQLKLISDEYLIDGPCGALSVWLQHHAQQYGFYLPYQAGRSGVSPEPWHLSYFPESSLYLAQYDRKSLKQLLSNSNISLKSALINRLDELVDRYVYFIADAPK